MSESEDPLDNMCYLWHTIARTPEYDCWRETLPAKEKNRLDGRIQKISVGFFIGSRCLGEGLFELKWKHGLRAYYSRTRTAAAAILVLWGGYKGSQNRDILKARRIKARYESDSD